MLRIPTPLLDGSSLPNHGGPIEDSVWAAWTFAPTIVLPVILAIWLYLRGVHRLGQHGRPMPRLRVLSFFFGLTAIFVALQSPIDRLGEHYLTFHMLQHELLIIFGAPFVLMGAPLRPMMLALPRGVRMGPIRAVSRMRWIRSFQATVLRAPMSAMPLIVALLGWHLPGPYNASLESDLVHDLMHFSFVGGAFILWWGVIDPIPTHRRGRHGAKVLAVLAFVPIRIAIGAPLTLAGRPVYEAYMRVTEILPLDRATDQQLGGLIMWVPGIMMHLIAAGLIFYGWAESQRPDPVDLPMREAHRLAEEVEQEHRA